jgi:ABC-type uncharacterized transport system ATPase subunit
MVVLRLLSAGVAAIVVEGLSKSYGSVEAVRGIDFAVEPGEVFALLTAGMVRTGCTPLPVG